MANFATRVLSLVLISMFFVGSCSNETKTAAFGEKVRFRKDTPVNFGEFTVDFKGVRQVPSEKFPQGFNYYDFRVIAGEEHVFVSWSSGTGDIAPASFEIGGRKFELEMKNSDKLGHLKDDEIVVWKK